MKVMTMKKTKTKEWKRENYDDQNITSATKKEIYYTMNCTDIYAPTFLHINFQFVFSINTLIF